MSQGGVCEPAPPRRPDESVGAALRFALQPLRLQQDPSGAGSPSSGAFPEQVDPHAAQRGVGGRQRWLAQSALGLVLAPPCSKQ